MKKISPQARVKGFTLIELIVVIAIIGVLAGILVPSLIGYVKRAQKKADVANARQIYNDISAVLYTDDNKYYCYSVGGSKVDHYWTPYESFYSKEVYNVGSVASYSSGNAGSAHLRRTINTPDGVKTCELTVKCILDGTGGTKQQWNVWKNGNTELLAFTEALNKLEFDNNSNNTNKNAVFNAKIQARTSDEGTLNRWFICYQNGSPDDIEIWVGSGSTGTSWDGNPLYRLYPNPSTEYS